MRSPHRYTLAALAALALLAAGCSSSSSPSSSSGPNWATVTSASSGGGMAKLIAAAKKEGTLNVIALPPTWANYGTIISTFEKKYGIKVNSANPDGSSQDEVNAVKQENGTAAAPDVLDVGMAVATANTSLFAPYKVSTWSDIPTAQKSSAGLWYQDYGGYMSVGYSSKFGTITSLSQLLGPKFKGAVALNGNPTEANAALNGVMLANLVEGGSASSIAKGVSFFQQLKSKGNFDSVQATGATIKAGTTPVVFNWDYLNLPSYVGVSNWKVFIPVGRGPGRLLRSGHQQERAAPGGREAVGGVPLLAGHRRRAEPVAGGRRAAGGAVGHDLQQHDQLRGRGEAAAGVGDAGVPHPVPGHRRR